MIRKPNFKLNWKYALGEVVLIFIGISLAIGFQNWNELRKDRKLEKHFYKLIISDMEATASDIREAMQTAKLRIRAGNNILRSINRDHQDIFLLEDMTLDSALNARYELLFQHLSSLSRDLTTCYLVQVIDNRIAGFEEITSSGKLQAIQNNQLRSDIVSVYQQLDDWAESNTFFRAAMARYADEMTAAGIAQQDMRPDDFILRKINESSTFQASIRSQMALGYEQNITYPFMIDYIMDFKHRIEEILREQE